MVGLASVMRGDDIASAGREVSAFGMFLWIGCAGDCSEVCQREVKRSLTFVTSFFHSQTDQNMVIPDPERKLSNFFDIGVLLEIPVLLFIRSEKNQLPNDSRKI
jgi:hypothetical protein